ncbi:MAG: GNAT family N-acetyltransferase [Clostridia bacterium]|nr:GNAT family N-acetyltransferase [Clostridia bacterium]
MELIPIWATDFDDIYEAMIEAFPYEERRDRAAARALLDEPAYRIFHTVRDGVRVGFITVWELGDIAFAEHFVTYPAYRNKGYGAQVIARLQGLYPQIVLEVEPPDTPLAARRMAFYGRTGFVANDYPYLQPSYHGARAGVPLVLMSYPEALVNPEAIAARLYKEVYKQ